MGFTVTIFAFFISFYFVSTEIFTASKQSFEFINNYSRRPICLANGYNFMIEAYT